MSTLKISKRNGIYEIKMARPDVRNAFNTDMIAALTKEFLQLNKTNDVKLVILKGEGKVFSAGADLAWMKAMVNYSLEENRQDAVILHQMFEAIFRCIHPVVAYVQGAAFGGALGLLACCDQVVCDKETQFCFSETKLGLVPAVISEFIFSKISPGFVAPYMLSAQVFDAHVAQRMGLVHSITEAAQAEVEISKLIDEWMQTGPEAVRSTKKLLRSIVGMQGDSLRHMTTQVIAERRVSGEGQEGLKSFLEKRAPHWRTFEAD
jgi:methylglutaconyl-CoA hydratase